MMTTLKTYSELTELLTYEDRVRYLKLDGIVGNDTFGFDRIFNQRFYRSKEWANVRDLVIARDLGNDMGLNDYPIFGKILIHHMNPITIDDIAKSSDFLLNPEYLISVSHNTHNLIHYGYEIKDPVPVERTAFDTCPWKRNL